MITNRPGWVTAVAVFHFVVGGLWTIVGLIALISFQFIADMLDEIIDVGEIRTIGLIVGGFYLLIAALQIIVGVYLLRLASWAQIVSIILNTLSLLGSVAVVVIAFSEEVFSVAITGLIFASMYGLWIYALLNPKSNAAFGRGGQACPSCGRAMDPSWEFCPYCQPQSQPIAPSALPTAAAPPPLAPTPMAPAAWPADPTQPLGPAAPPAAPGAPMPGYATSPIPSQPGFPATEPLAPFPPTPAAPPPLQPTQLIQQEPTTMAWLVLESGPHAGREIRLRGESVSLGRDPRLNEIVLDDPTVSSQHARIRLQEGQLVLYDLASTNGTFVNEEQTQKRVLQDGDQVRLGNVQLRFMMISPPSQEGPGEKPATSD